MKEKILAALKTKFQGVDEAILARIASNKAEGITDESQINSIIEGISFQHVLNSYGDFRAGDARISAVANYEKKHNLKDGKPIKEPEEKKDEKKDNKKDEVPSWAQALIDSNKSLSEKLSAYEAKEAQAQRNSQISTVAKKYGIPEFMLKDRNIPENTDLDTYFKDLKQEMSNSGFQFSKAPETAEQKQEKEASEIVSLINKGTEEINKQN